MRFSKPAAVAVLTVVFAYLAAPPARALDVDPGDYAAAPPGTSLILGYGQFNWYNSFHTRSGNEIHDSELQSQVGILRVVHYVNVFGVTCDPQFFIPFAGLNNAKLGGEHLDSTFGMGDIIIASTCWVVNQPEKQRWVGITPFVFFPTGSYRDKQVLNVGENRYKGVLQVGYVEAFGKWSVDLIADTTFYGNNDSAGPEGNNTLRQDNSYQAQAWLRRALTDELSLGVGWSGTWGGNQYVAGESNKLSTEAQQLRLITQYFVLPDLQLQAHARTDVWSEGGYRETFGLHLRVMKVF